MNLLDLLFPKQCFACGRWSDYLCLVCRNSLKPRQFQICPQCTRASIGGKTHPGCQNRYSLDGLSICYPYTGTIRQMLKKLKYGSRLTDISQTLISLSLPLLKDNSHLASFCQRQPVVIPIPLHLFRRIWRGFNQAEVLAKCFAKSCGMGFNPKIIKRIRATKPQYGLNKKERDDNLNSAFALTHPQAAKNLKEVLLVDDIWTTGATMRICARVLKKGGVRWIWGITIAG